MGDVHRAAFALACTGRTPEEFGPQLSKRHAFGKVIVQAAINGDDVVVLTKVHAPTGADAFLPAGRVVNQPNLSAHQHASKPLIAEFDATLYFEHLQQRVAVRGIGAFNVWHE
jgi:hypothetical protein